MAGRCEPAYHCGRIPSCDCHSQKSIQPSDPVTTSVPEKSKGKALENFPYSVCSNEL